MENAPSNTSRLKRATPVATSRQTHEPAAKRIRKIDFPAALVFDQEGEVVGELTPTQRKLWPQPIASKFCARMLPPANQYRRLGIICRTLTGAVAIEDLEHNFSMVKSCSRLSSNPPNVSKRDARKFAQGDSLRSGRHRTDAQLSVDAETIRSEWKQVGREGRIRPFWNSDGEMCAMGSRVSLLKLRDKLEDGTLQDAHVGQVKAIYDGLRYIPIDTSSVIKALVDLQLPTEPLWNLPIVLSYPRFQEGELSIGIYASRMLFEMMTATSLQCVMAALEENSVSVSRPLAYPHSCKSPVFESDSEGVAYEKPTESDATIKGSTRQSGNAPYAFSNDGFLKLCENKGNDTSNLPILKSKLDGKLQVELMLHQSHGLCWMHQMEALPSINSILWEQRRFPDGGTYYYAPASGQIRLFLGSGWDEEPPRVRGGILADEMGLGKTVTTLALILATLDELKEEARRNSNHESTHATLIVVPPALVSQWLNEIEKTTGGHLAVDFFNHKELEYERRSRKPGRADVVVTTYGALAPERAKSRTQCSAVNSLKSKSWGRVVLDEMQEIRSSTTTIATNCEELRCTRRWMLSGTPLFEGVKDFRGELCFLRLEPFAGNCDDGFFKFAVEDHWEAENVNGLDTLQILSLVMLRRSKSMTVRQTGLPLLGLKPLTVVFQPVAQDPSERALYCFLEHLVHSTLQHADDDETKHQSLLRLLREACVSTVLLGGGLGCRSQLETINRLMIDLNRSEFSGEKGELQPPTDSAISCDDAIRFLGQVLEVARVGDGFVTNLTMGTGGGISRRDRAVVSPQEQLREAKDAITSAVQKIKDSEKKRAQANWQRLLEKVTTGCLPWSFYKTSPRSRSLWLWRWLLSAHTTDNKRRSGILFRGWRPGTRFYSSESSARAKARWQWVLQKICSGEVELTLKDEDIEKMPWSRARILATWKWRFLRSNRGLIGNGLSSCRPQKKLVQELALKWLYSHKPIFRWAHPRCLLLTGIPSGVTSTEVRKSIRSVIPNGGPFDVAVVTKAGTQPTWSVYIQFAFKSDYDSVRKACSGKDGLILETKAEFHFVKCELEEAKEQYRKARDEFSVFPCAATLKKKDAASKRLRAAKLGLRILPTELGGHVHCDRPVHNLRSAAYGSSTKFLVHTRHIADKSSVEIDANKVIRQENELAVTRLERVLKRDIDASSQANNAFKKLQFLKRGDRDQTTCAVCLEPLGVGGNSRGLVNVTPCGHLFCVGCLSKYAKEKLAEGNSSPPCIECRKPLQLTLVKKVDPDLKADEEVFKNRRKEAARLVQEAASIIQRSDGQLTARLWEALYLNIEPPADAGSCSHPIHTAIPSPVLAHLQQATGMVAGAAPEMRPPRRYVFSSKVRELLSDIEKLPRSERVVVFASSKQTIQLLLCVLALKEMGSRALFAGQTERKSATAVMDWAECEDVRILVVQAGAAACGLTLTAASKMFILEPFVKHEQEKQAYARLHRCGQTEDVVCKVYFAPVSVESRLLDWRKRAGGSHTTPEQQLVYAPLKSGDPTSTGHEDDQTRFLLGVDNAEPSASETASSMSLSDES